MGIETDSTPLEAPKNPETCNVFNIYKLMASKEEVEEMRHNYQGGNYGYGHSKQALFELIANRFSEERRRYNYFMENVSEIEAALAAGAAQANEVANEVLRRVRTKLGY